MGRGRRGGRAAGLLLPLGVLLLFVLATFLPSLSAGAASRSRRARALLRGRCGAGGDLVTARFRHGEVTVLTDARGAFRLEQPPAEEGTWLARWGPLRAEVAAAGRGPCGSCLPEPSPSPAAW